MKKINKEGLYSTISLAVGFLFLLVGVLGVTVSHVNGDSMDPTLKNGTYMIGRVAKSLNYGDIVGIKSANADASYVKRIIGKPGDKIEIKGDKVFRNGKELKEDYIKEPMKYNDDQQIILDEDQYWVMGDNRNHSSDSRELGAFHRLEITEVLFKN